MKRILLDTNILMAIGTLKVDIFSELERICDFGYELITLDSVLEELESIIEKQTLKYGKAAKLALSAVKIKNIKIIKSGILPADDGILALDSKDLIVATQDMELKKKLKAKGVEVIVLRQKKYLMMG